MKFNEEVCRIMTNKLARSRYEEVKFSKEEKIWMKEFSKHYEL